MAQGRCPGMVHLVGAGPGDPELITRKGARLIEAAEVILYDSLVNPALLDLARPEAELIFAGKRRDHHFMRQYEINRLLVERAWAGQRVVRLKGGDPMIFGRAGEELEALATHGVPFEVVPGVTAAAGCAAAAAIPLTHRDHAQTLILATGHAKDGEPDLDWQALCRPRQTLVFYMGHNALPGLVRPPHRERPRQRHARRDDRERHPARPARHPRHAGRPAGQGCRQSPARAGAADHRRCGDGAGAGCGGANGRLTSCPYGRGRILYFWLLERAVYGSFRHVSKQYLHRYCESTRSAGIGGSEPMRRGLRTCYG